jgi:hypothetical protein
MLIYRFKKLLLFFHPFTGSGIPQQLGTRQIARLIAFSQGYFVFKNENVKVKVKYGFVLHTGFAGSTLLL